MRLRLSDLGHSGPTPFRLEPDAAAREDLAARLGASAIRKLSFRGRLLPRGRRDWELEAELGATVVQPCIATLAPVTTRIDEQVARIFTQDFAEPEDDESEIPEDDRLEPLPEVLDLTAVMEEALALALPLYPRAEGAEPGTTAVAPPGTAPLSDADIRPFAGLKALRDRLKPDTDD